MAAAFKVIEAPIPFKAVGVGEVPNMALHVYQGMAVVLHGIHVEKFAKKLCNGPSILKFNSEILLQYIYY